MVGTSVADHEHRRTERWRRMLLPLITRMLIGLTVFFFAVSLGQLTYLHWRVEQAPSVDLDAPFALLTKAAAGGGSDGVNAASAMILATLESNALARRYHQASVVLMARVWTSYLGFVTGMMLALVGAAFTLGRVQETATSIEAKAGEMGGSLRTAAPGIVLVTVGVALMIATLFVHYDITVADSAVYTRSLQKLDGAPAPKPPPIPFPASATPGDAATPKQ